MSRKEIKAFLDNPDAPIDTKIVHAIIKSGIRQSYILYSLVVGLIVALAIVGTIAIQGNTNTAHSSCVIQARGLPAGHYLAAGLGGLSTFLQLIATPGAEETAPPQLLSAYKKTVNNLNAYEKIEKTQPRTRKC